MSWINIARTGRFRDMSGREVNLTSEALSSIATSYDPAKRQAPLVFGHPALNGPAFGWVEQVRLVGDVLQAKFRDVPDEVRQLVSAGRYRHVSMSLFPDGGLRHVGLLGATPPAIDGLGEVEFGADTETTTIEFSAEPQGSGEEGMTIEEARKRIEELEGQNRQLTTQREEAVQAKDKTTADFAAYRGEQEAKAREARFEALVTTEKVLPAEKEQVLGFAATLGKAGATINFAAEGKVEQISQEEAYWRSLEARPKNGLLTEFATASRAASGKATEDTTPADLTSKV